MRFTRAALALSLPAILFLLHSLGHGPVFVDDAYIFYRYASNLAAGHGLVYNIGEYVEGYSSLLWTLLLAVGTGVSIPPDVLAPVLGAVLGIVCLVLLTYSARFAIPNSAAAAVALPIACSLSTGFTYYAVSGMDTILFAAVLLTTLVSALASSERGRIASLSACLAMLVIVRAEGFLYALVVLAVLGLTLRQGVQHTMLSWRRYGLVVAITCAAIILQFGGRRLLYGDWIPATVSAKAYTTFALQSALGSSPRNLRPFLDALVEGIRYERFVAPLAIIPGLILLSHGLRKRTLPLFPALLAGSILINMAVTIWASGDWMDYHRHIVPVWPVWLLLIAWALWQACKDFHLRPRLANAVVAVGLLGAGWYAVEAPVGPPTLAAGSAAPESGRSLYKRQVGMLLHQFGAPVTVVTNVAGKLPYYAGRGTYARDLLGLTDEYNAKHGNVWSPTYGRTDYEYSFGQPFDLLVTNSYADLEYLLAYWDAHADARHQYALYAGEEWTANCFFVVAKPRDPLGARLQELCACQPRPLDERFLERVRALPLCSGVTDGS